MKKAVRFTAILAALSLCLALAGCGEQSSTVSARDNLTEQQPPKTVEPLASNPSPSEANPTLESYLDSIRSVVDSMISSADMEGLQMEITAEGNSLVYSYQYTTDLGVDNAIMKVALDAELDKVDEVFQEVLLSLQEAVPDTEAVVVRYLDHTGQLITRRTWDSADISITPSGGLDAEDYLSSAFTENQGITLEEYLESIRSELDAMIASYADQGMQMEVKADGDCLVYVYQYTTDLGVDNALLKEALDNELDKVDDTFESVLASLKAEVPSAKAVVVQYLDYTGQLVTQRTWGSADQPLTQTSLSAGTSAGTDPLLESYVETIRAELADEIESYASMGIQMEILAEGHNLVYRYRYTVDLGLPNEEAKTSLDDTLAQNNEVFTQALTAIQAEIPSTEAVVVQYWDVDGNLITSREWR